MRAKRPEANRNRGETTLGAKCIRHFPTRTQVNCGYVPFVIVTLFLSSFTNYNLILTRVTGRVTLVEQELLTLPEHPTWNSLPVFSGIRVVHFVQLHVITFRAVMLIRFARKNDVRFMFTLICFVGFIFISPANKVWGGGYIGITLSVRPSMYLVSATPTKRLIGIFMKLYTFVIHYLQKCMKEYGCCPKFKRGDNSTYTFTKRGWGHVPCKRNSY